jgi:hypothetical protein
MANWCSNYVEYKGEEANINSLLEELRELEEENRRTGLGVRPSEEGDLKYMFELYVEDEYFSFESKWSPANDSLQFLAKKHKVTITNQYSELGCMVFGQWIGDGETEKDVWLTNEELDLVVPGDEDGSFYIYNGEEYEIQEDALKEILDKKLRS